MPHRLSRLLYRSQLREDIQWLDVVNIASQARENNQKHDITGLLLTNDSEVLQVLEWPLSHLNTLYNNITRDERHDNVELLAFEAIPERNFPHWKMKEVNVARFEGNLGSALSCFMVETRDAERADHSGRTHIFSHDALKCYAMLAFVNAITSQR